MAAKAASFATGDVVTLKGQSHAMTVVDQPTNATSQEGWQWVAYSHSAGVALTLLPREALVKKTRR